MCIPTRTRLTYNNDKPWFTAKLRQHRQAKKLRQLRQAKKLRQLRRAKEDAYRKGDMVLYKQTNYTMDKEIRVAKRNYSGKLRKKILSSDFASAWKGLKDITNYKTPSPSTLENQQLADAFNEFYCRLRFLGTTISQDLKWENHIKSMVVKAQQRLYFLHQLKKFNLSQELLIQFYSSLNPSSAHQQLSGSAQLPNLTSEDYGG